MQAQHPNQPNRRERPIGSEEVLVVKSFKAHLRAVAEPEVLDLLYLAQIRSVTNEDVRAAFNLKRSGAYKRLDALRELGLLEKRDGAYRTSEYAGRLVSAVSQLFRGAMRGNIKTPQPVDASTLEKMRILEVCKFAEEGAQTMYNRGNFNQDELYRRRKLVSQVREAYRDAQAER